MAKGVLGNDPFLRGAALRGVPPEAPSAAPAPAVVAPAALAPRKTSSPKAAPKSAATPKATPQKKSAPRPEAPVVVPTAQTAAQENGVRIPPGEAAVVTKPLENVLRPAPTPASPATLSVVPLEAPPLSSFAASSRGSEEEALLPRLLKALEARRQQGARLMNNPSLAPWLRVAQGLWGATRAGLGTAAAVPLDVYGQDARLSDQLEPVMRFFYERYWRVSVEGAEHLPSGPVLLVVNHSGALPFDGPVMQFALKQERPELQAARWLVEDQIFYAPMMGTLLNRLGAVRACPENAIRLLEEQRPVVVFPEGFQALSKPFAQRYQLKRFGRGGFVKLALRTGAPLVPVAIVGAEETSPLLGRLPGGMLGLPYLPLLPLGPVPLPAKWRIRMGPPLDLQGLGPAQAEDLGTVLRLTERTREAIQGLLKGLLAERQSVLAG